MIKNLPSIVQKDVHRQAGNVLPTQQTSPETVGKTIESLTGPRWCALSRADPGRREPA